MFDGVWAMVVHLVGAEFATFGLIVWLFIIGVCLMD